MVPANVQRNEIKAYFDKDGVKQKFEELMGKRSTGFITSLLSLVNGSDYLKKASPESIYMSAMMAATLDLPINQNLGFAYIIPYNDKDKGQVAQFQIGYKGFIQLALRSGQFKTISACPIYEGQLVEENPLTGYVFDFKKKVSETVIGYAAYFSLINGFEKSDYWTIEEIKQHGKKFSKTFGNKFGVWEKDFDAMAMKTVLKLLLAKYAPLSVEMQKAVVVDQSVINDAETLDVEYVDAEKDGIKKESQATKIQNAVKDSPLTPLGETLNRITSCKTIQQLDDLFDVTANADEFLEQFKAKREELKK